MEAWRGGDGRTGAAERHPKREPWSGREGAPERRQARAAAHGADVVLLGHELRIHSPHLRDERPHERAEKAELAAELVPVAHGAAQHTAQNVVAALGARRGAVSDREGERADVVSDDAVRHVEAVGVVGADLVGVRPRPCMHPMHNLAQLSTLLPARVAAAVATGAGGHAAGAGSGGYRVQAQQLWREGHESRLRRRAGGSSAASGDGCTCRGGPQHSR